MKRIHKVTLLIIILLGFKSIDAQPVEVDSICENTIVSNNIPYKNALEKIGIKDQIERKNEVVNWQIQNQLDLENRIALDSLYNLYGFPTVEKVGKRGILDAFIVLHHSVDCNWNAIWTPRFIEHYDQLGFKPMLHFFIYRTYSDKEGFCKTNKEFLNQLSIKRTEEPLSTLLDFSKFYAAKRKK